MEASHFGPWFENQKGASAFFLVYFGLFLTCLDILVKKVAPGLALTNAFSKKVQFGFQEELSHGLS